MTRRRPFLFILAACLAAAGISTSCGSQTRTPTKEERSERAGGSAIEPAPAPARPSPENDARRTIVTFGDSLTAGVAGRSYPDNLQDLLDQNGFDLRVDNQGVSGDTTTDGSARIENVIAEHPVLVVLEFGGNDGLRGIPIDSTRANLERMITRLREVKIPVALLGITLPPNYGPEYVRPFTAMFPQLAAKYHLRLIPFLLSNVYQHPELMQPDGIHPNGEGNKVVAGDVYRVIEPMLAGQKRKPGR